MLYVEFHIMCVWEVDFHVKLKWHDLMRPQKFLIEVTSILTTAEESIVYVIFIEHNKIPILKLFKLNTIKRLNV